MRRRGAWRRSTSGRACPASMSPRVRSTRFIVFSRAWTAGGGPHAGGGQTRSAVRCAGATTRRSVDPTQARRPVRVIPVRRRSASWRPGVDARRPHRRPRASATISAVVLDDRERSIDRSCDGGSTASRSCPLTASSVSASLGGGLITAAGCPLFVTRIVSPPATRRSTSALSLRIWRCVISSTSHSEAQLAVPESWRAVGRTSPRFGTSRSVIVQSPARRPGIAGMPGRR